jgi:hypothetical protein
MPALRMLRGVDLRLMPAWVHSEKCFNHYVLWLEEITMEIRKYLEPKSDETITQQNLWDAVKTIIKRKIGDRRCGSSGGASTLQV